jgi:predicted nuclease with TOPRIM domain
MDVAVREKLQARLEELRQQFRTGHSELQELQAREAYLRETTLRLSGAIQVLEELLAEVPPSAGEESGDVTVSRTEVERAPVGRGDG